MKKTWKLVFCLLLAAIMVFSFTACTQASIVEQEVDTFVSEGVKYIVINKLDADGKVLDTYAKVSGYQGDETEHILIPTLVNDIPVKVIGGLAFFESKMRSITLSEGIERIDNFAFGYSNLIRVEMPSTIKSIGDYAFINCLALKRVDIKAVERPTMGSDAFKFYDKNDKQYKVSDLVLIYVPQIENYKTNDVHDLWNEYQNNLKKLEAQS